MNVAVRIGNAATIKRLEASAVQQLRLAYSLIEYGRKNNAPEALITAARILAANGTVEMKEKPTQEKLPGTAKDPEEAKKPADNSPRALLAEAKKLSKSNAAVVALANSIELPRGAVGGPKRGVTTVRARTGLKTSFAPAMRRWMLMSLS